MIEIRTFWHDGVPEAVLANRQQLREWLEEEWMRLRFCDGLWAEVWVDGVCISERLDCKMDLDYELEEVERAGLGRFDDQ